MKILMLTTYYYPHISGLTLYFQRLAEEYVKLGHDVTIICAQHDKKLPKRENVNGVDVIRTPYILKINKGMILHKIIFDVWNPLKSADVLHVNLPSVEAMPTVLLAKLFKKPVASTYVCDITLPKFIGSKLLDFLIDINHYFVLKLSDKINSFTIDFANHSRVLKRFNVKKEIYPIVKLQNKTPITIKRLADSTRPRIGMATRIATDKGIEYMIDALPKIWEKFPDAKLFIVGTVHAVGEERYFEKLKPLFDKYAEKIILLGQVEPEAMPYFFKNIDLLVVSSVNSTEAFGMVQVEAMFEGTSVVATDLPGVRVPVQITGMGDIAKIADSDDLANKIVQVLKKKPAKNEHVLTTKFDTNSLTKQYLDFYKTAIKSR